MKVVIFKSKTGFIFVVFFLHYSMFYCALLALGRLRTGKGVSGLLHEANFFVYNVFLGLTVLT